MEVKPGGLIASGTVAHGPWFNMSGFECPNCISFKASIPEPQIMGSLWLVDTINKATAASPLTFDVVPRTEHEEALAAARQLQKETFQRFEVLHKDYVELRAEHEALKARMAERDAALRRVVRL
jgi:hypothetical protein